MAKVSLQTEGLEKELQRLQELCNQKPMDLKAANELYKTLYARLGQLRSNIFLVMHETQKVEPAKVSNKPAVSKKEPKKVDPRFSYQYPERTIQAGLNYTTPMTPQELKELLKRTFGASSKPLEFSDALLEQGMRQVHLEYRGDWAVYLTLLAKPKKALNESQLEKATGYNIGSVAGSLNRLLLQGLVEVAGNNGFVVAN